MTCSESVYSQWLSVLLALAGRYRPGMVGVLLKVLGPVGRDMVAVVQANDWQLPVVYICWAERGVLGLM